jgi:NAD+ synthase
VKEYLKLDLEAEVGHISQCIRAALREKLHRRGLVVAISGGVDSSVAAALAVRTIGKRKVFGVLMPERESSTESTKLGRMLARHLDIDFIVQDIGPTLQAIGCYAERDAAIRSVVPDYDEKWKSKIVISGGLEGAINHFHLVVQDPEGRESAADLPLKAYLAIVAATNYKQRVRKTIEYFHADRLNYAVVGTPNRLEYDQGFFVKNGDGAADIKPMAHLYKSQVYALANHLGLPEPICSTQPTTDTYTLPQGQDEFYFALPYEQMDIALYFRDHGYESARLAGEIGVSPGVAENVYRDIDTKRRTTAYQHLPPILMREPFAHA